MGCDMCGKETDKVFKTIIEGSPLSVCSECSKHGKTIEIVERVSEREKGRREQPKQEKPIEPEIVEELVEDYSGKIRRKREKMGLKQEELAKKLNEKESILQKIENGDFTPPMVLARKIERFLGLKLVEEVEEERVSLSKGGSGEGFTMGDFIKVKKK